VSELIVVFASCVLSLIAAAAEVRGLYGRTARQRELDRLLGAVERAGADFLWQETRLLGALLVIVALAFALPALLWRGTRLTDTAWLMFSALGLGAGALCGGLVAQLAHWAAARATAGSLAALRERDEVPEAAAFRGAVVSALGVDALSSLLVLGVLWAHQAFLVWRGHEPGAAFLEATRSAPAAALGACCAAAIFQVGGGSFHTSAGVAGASARARHERVARDEEQNPALVAELVGDFVGGMVCRSTDVFSALVLGNTALLAVAAAVARANPALGRAAIGVVCLPLVLRAMGLLSSAISARSLRFEAGLPTHRAFLGAGASHALVLLSGLLGATLWLLGDAVYPVFVGAGACGILASVLLEAFLLTEGRAQPTSALGGRLPETSVARALGLGLQRAWAPLLTVGACLGTAYVIGARSPLARGEALGLLVAVATLLGSGALHLGESAFSSIGENVLRIVGLRRGRFDVAARSRASELARAGLVVGNLGYTQGILAGAAAALLGALMLPLIAAAAPLDSTVGKGHPIVILGGIVGAASLLFHVGGMLKLSSRAASAVDGDAGERLTRSPSDGSPALALLPSYRQSVQLAARTATDSLLPECATTLLGPLVVGVLLRLTCGSSGSGFAAQGLMAFASSAALTGCCAALAAQGALMALGTPRPVPEDAPELALSRNPSSAREFMGRSIGPAASFGLKATVISSLVIAPLLF
jgi:Na+/H+-translocating membrane pyrophosphatase